MSKPIGLNNQGNTCYMNSGIQLITNSTYIMKNLVDNRKSGEFTEEGAKLVCAQSRGSSVTPLSIK